MAGRDDICTLWRIKSPALRVKLDNDVQSTHHFEGISKKKQGKQVWGKAKFKTTEMKLLSQLPVKW